jgi:hypothetical protein
MLSLARGLEKDGRSGGNVKVIHGAKRLKENMFWLFCEEV